MTNSDCNDAQIIRALAACLDDAPPMFNVNRVYECGEFVHYKVEGRREIFREPAVEWMRNPIEAR